MNMLYIDDFIIWTQNLKEQDILDLRKNIIEILSKNKLNKKAMGLELEEYEQEAVLDLNSCSDEEEV